MSEIREEARFNVQAALEHMHHVEDDVEEGNWDSAQAALIDVFEYLSRLDSDLDRLNT